ncbi:MAG: trimethylamine methyltransferase family protein [Thermodesulfobacteriota bacterium]|nr:trimethylamine methyltransferase family protein [Thermodesulfobacteriota bacterium]
MKKGFEGGAYKPLSEGDISKIHETSMRVIEEVGVEVNSERALELFEKNGGYIDPETQIVKLPRELTMELIGKAPNIITLCGRDPEHDITLGGRRVHMGTGGTALYVIDPDTGKKRPSQLEDIKNIGRLVDSLENIHFYMLSVFPNDLPPENVDVNRFGTALNYTRKHVMGGVYTIEGVRNVIKMAEMICGSAEELRERPIISMVSCGVSPFKMDEHYSDLTITIAQAGIPVVTPAEPLCGATAPVTLAGNLVVQNVDTLMGVILTQMVNPGTPVLYGCISSLADMRDMKYLSGAIEMGLMNAAAAQMAQFYSLPIYATAGMSDSKVNDAQAGYESALTGLLVALAGANYIHDAAGFLEFCMAASYEKYVIDNEIIGMTMRAVEGIKVTDETLAFDLIKEIGPGGHFVSSAHTRKFMRKEQYRPTLSDRENRDKWEAVGSTTTDQRAREKVSLVLNGPEKTCIDPEVREKIKHEIPGIVSEMMK